MRILIINLPRYKEFSVTREGRCEFITKSRVDTPTTLLTIAAILKEMNHQVSFIDANGLNLKYEDITEYLMFKTFDCIIFSINSTIIDHELKFCDIIKNKQPSCITIAFSWYARNFGFEILSEYENLDIIITDDTFSVIDNLIESLSERKNLVNVRGIGYRDYKNEIRINNKVIKIRSINNLPMPAYDLLPSLEPYYIYLKDLKPYALIYSGKGCSYNCNYCNVANTKYSYKAAEEIIEELKYLKKVANVQYVWFFDEIFTINRARVIKICNYIIREKLNIKWFCDSRVDLIDEGLLRIMKKGGCIGIAYGVESGSQKILNAMNKRIIISHAKEILKLTRKIHIPIQMNIILGYIGENYKTLRQTRQIIKEILPEILQIVPIMSIDGTNFTKLAIKNNWIDPNINWKDRLKTQVLKYELYPPFNLNLKSEIQKLYRILYRNPKWWLVIINSLIHNNCLIIPILKGLFRKHQIFSDFFKYF